MNELSGRNRSLADFGGSWQIFYLHKGPPFLLAISLLLPETKQQQNIGYFAKNLFVI